jgi:hypothetical protein
MILRQAGYVVHETTILAMALSKMGSDSIDGVLICNSIPRKEQEWFVMQVTNKRRLLPILCIKSHPYDQSIPGCTGVDGEPDALLAVVSRTLNVRPISASNLTVNGIEGHNG